MNALIKLQAIVLLLQCCKARYFQKAINEHRAQKQYFPEVQRSYYQNQYDIHNGPSNYRRYNFNSDGPGSCECSCKKCVYKPTQCCMMICNSCQQIQPQQEFAQTLQPQEEFHQTIQPQQAQFQPPSLSLFMVPLPVPFLVHLPTTQSSSTTSVKPVEEITTSATPASTTTTTRRLTTTTTTTTKTTTTRKAQNTTSKKPTRPKRQPEVLKNPKCSARSQCFRNYMDYEDDLNLIEYKYLRSKASATVTIDSSKRNSEILNNIRPTIGMKVRRSMVTHRQSLPKYGLVQIIPADEPEIMMQSY